VSKSWGPGARGRLQKLASLDLVDNIGGGRWQLADAFEETPRRPGERSEVIRTMQWALKEKGLSRPWLDRVEFLGTESDAASLVGRVVMRGLTDEHRDRHYLIVDAVDGQSIMSTSGSEFASPTAWSSESPRQMADAIRSTRIFATIPGPPRRSPRLMSAGWRRSGARRPERGAPIP